eukprot:6193543-Pleurochrysis_carterae.AAC.1
MHKAGLVHTTAVLRVSGFWYMTAHGYSDFFQSDPEGVAKGTLTLTLVSPPTAGIKPEQLQALKDIYYTNCKPTQARAHGALR